MASSLPLTELNALLDSFIPLIKKVDIAKTEALEKEAEALEKILIRAWMVMPYLHENDEPGQCVLINRTERVTVEHCGTASSTFAINDRQKISCLDAIKTYGFEEICAALVDMIEFNGGLEMEYKALQTRIERANSLIETIGEKFKVECLESAKALEVLQ